MPRVNPLGRALAVSSIFALLSCSTTKNSTAAPEPAAPAQPSGDMLAASPTNALVSLPEGVVDDPTPLELPPLLELMLQREDPSTAPLYSDPNQRPIHIRVVGDERGVDEIYVVGHADGECCPRVSGVVHDASNVGGLRERFFSFGVGHLSAGTAAARAELAQAAVKLARIAEQPQCRGQVHYTRLATDTVASELATLTDTARMAYSAAVRSDRALVLWYDLQPDALALAPLYVPAAGGGIEPLKIRLPESTFAFPTSLIDNLSLDGSAQYIAALKQAIATIKAIQRLPTDATGRPQIQVATSTIKETYELNYRAKQLEAKIEASISDLTRVIENEKTLVPVLELLPPAEAKAAVARASSTLEKLTNALIDNRRSLSTVRGLPPKATSSSKTIVSYTDVTTEVLDLSDIVPNPDNLRASQLPEFERKLAQAQAGPHHPPADPWPSLVDAGLRGWPATFSSAKAEKEFDRWLTKNQLQLWKTIDGQLRSDGVNLGDPGQAVHTLRTSNLVFRVQHDKGEIVIEPVLVLSGPFYLVADPAAHLVRYESVIADQNLATL